MQTGKNNFGVLAGGFLLGGLVGGLAALLYSPKSGKETRYDINKYTRFARIKKRRLLNDAKEQSRALVGKAEEILAKSREYADGKYKDSADTFEREITALKAGYQKALETYRNYHQTSKPTEKMVDEIFIDFDENLPKFAGMGRGNNI